MNIDKYNPPIQLRVRVADTNGEEWVPSRKRECFNCKEPVWESLSMGSLGYIGTIVCEHCLPELVELLG